MLATITPDITASYSVTTRFTVTFPNTHGGFVLIGEAVMPFVNVSDVSGIRVWDGSSVVFTLNGPYRVRIYYIASGSSTILDTFDDFYVNVSDSPIVTVNNYGKNASFKDSTLVEIKANIPCEIEYNLLNLEDKTLNTVIANIDSSLVYNLELLSSCNMDILARANGKESKKLHYSFRREPGNTKSLYTTWLNDQGILMNNIDEQVMFIQ